MIKRKPEEKIKEILYQKMLAHVEKPGRYIGKEYNEIIKQDDHQMVKVALSFPDLYEIGMSYLGFKILYHIINGRKDALAERVFAPAGDMEKFMLKEKIPLFSLESYRPLHDFDIVGFSLQHELCYTNVLYMLDLGKIPLRSAHRGVKDPLIIAGGPSAFNPEPLADFVDAFILGDGEEIIQEIIDLGQWWSREGKTKVRKDYLKELSQVEGVYIPSFYDIFYFPDGTIQSVQKKEPKAPSKVVKRIVSDLDTVPFPIAPIVPNIDIIHNRITLEIFRGCTRGCRFCQAGMIYRPVRERSVNHLLELAEKNVLHTGYEEISLSSLSSSDYSHIESLIKELVDRYHEKGIAISLPSLRIDNFSVELARETQRVRKTGLTFAPEVGTKRMCDVVNKNVSEEDLFQAVTFAFKEGWRRIKLYFMIGLPTETWDDIEGIVQLIKKVESIGRKMVGYKFSLNVSINAFIPKPHTPFQWVAQENRDQLAEKFSYITRKIRSQNISYNFPDGNLSLLEAVFARGDRRLGEVVEEAYRMGCKFDSWREYFHYEYWEKAFQKKGIDPSFYAHREREKDEIMPWDSIDCGVSKGFLWLEWQRALAGIPTQDCRWTGCKGCGLQQVCHELMKDDSAIPVNSNRG